MERAQDFFFLSFLCFSYMKDKLIHVKFIYSIHMKSMLPKEAFVHN